MDRLESKIFEPGLRPSIIISLTARQRRFAGLTDLGYSYKQIAAMDGCSTKAVASALFNVRKKMEREYLWKQEDGACFAARLGIIEPLLSDRVFCSEIRGLPPSINSAYPNVPGKGALKGRYISKEGREWKLLAAKCLRDSAWKPRNCDIPIPAPTGVKIFLHIPYAKDGTLKVPNWDVDNRVKIILDSLTENGVWRDDRWNETVEVHRRYSSELTEPVTEIIVWRKGGVEIVERELQKAS